MRGTKTIIFHANAAVKAKCPKLQSFIGILSNSYLRSLANLFSSQETYWFTLSSRRYKRLAWICSDFICYICYSLTDYILFQYIELIFQFPYLGLRFLHNLSSWRKKQLKYALIAHKLFFWSWELYLLLFNPPLLSIPLRSDFMHLVTHHTL